MNEHPKTSTSENRRFALLLCLMAAVLLATCVFYRLPILYEPRWSRELFIWPVTIALLALYWCGYQMMRTRTIKMKWVWLSSLLLTIAAVSIPPFHSTDLYGYINRGWQQLHYGLNPYVYTVARIPGWETDPMITDHWVNNPSPYGFLYLLIAKLLCWLGQGDKALTIMLVKASNGLLHLLTAGLIWLGVRRLNERDPGEAAPKGNINPELALYLYLWNPLVLIHTLANGHNDIWMGFFVTLSALLGLLGSWLWILPALMAATLIKYGALVILPLALLFLLKNRAWTALVGGLALAALLFWLTGLPYLSDWQQFHLSEIRHNAFVSHGSLHSFFYTLAKYLDKTLLPALHPYRDVVRDILKNLLLGAYAVFFARLCWQRFRQAGYPATQWVRDSLLVMATLICLISLKFYPWYLGMFFPLVFYLREEDWLRRFVLVLSGAQLFSITFIGQAHLLNFLVMTGLPLGWLIWDWRQRKQKPLISDEAGTA